MQTFRIIDENPSHENAASKLVLAAVRFFILAVLMTVNGIFSYFMPVKGMEDQLCKALTVAFGPSEK